MQTNYLLLAFAFLFCWNTSLIATDYHIGEFQTYKTISAVPWETLSAGDRVFIHHRTAPYREKIVIRGQGTANQPISIIGVPNANGDLPVLNGEGATSSATDYYSTGNNSLNLRSLIAISRGANDPFTYKPKHIVIEGLELKKAHPDFAYVEDGIQRGYIDAAAGIYIDAGDNISIRNCEIHHCANAIFANSRPVESQLSRNILIEGNYFYQCGVVGNYRRHTTYIQAVNAIYQYNRYEDMLDGSLGNPIKDRSSGTVIRYNWIVSNAQALDLVETQEGAPLTLGEPAYKETHVYGNLIHNKPKGATYLVHYGGDGYDYATYRRGKLYFYHITVINQSDVLDRYRVILFRLPLDQETTDQNTGINHPIEESVEAYNNIIYNESETIGEQPSNLSFYRTNEAANIVAGKNWVSPSVAENEPLSGYSGSVQGWANVLIGSAANDPGFINMATLDFRLRADATVIDEGQALPVDLQNQHQTDKIYIKHNSFEPRTIAGVDPDLGYAEYVDNTTNTTNYYVSNNGDNSNDGLTLATAFQTIQHAGDQVQAGDTVFVENGTYAGFDHRATSGTASQPIVFKALGNAVEITSKGPKRNDGINIEGVDYIVIDGFRVIGVGTTGNGNGIRIVLANNCVVRNCLCDNNGDRGIFTGFTDDILIEYNVCSNSKDEHGIYVSNSSDRPIIRYNECYGNNNIGIHINGDKSAGGDGIISDAQVYGNIIHDNNLAAGINMDGVENPIIYNNLIYNNHFSQGIALFQQDGAIPTRGAKVYNNTIIVPSDGRWGILVKNGSNVDTEIYNNIIINQHAWRGCIALENQTGFKSDYNLLNDKMSASGDGSSIPLADWQMLGFDQNSILAPVLADIFININAADFQLADNSPAINAGTGLVSSIVTTDITGLSRPYGVTYDIGAYESLIVASESIVSEHLMLYPNPTLGEVFLESEQLIHAISLYNTSGKLIQSFPKNSSILDLRAIPNGIYFLKLELPNHKVIYHKLIRSSSY